MPIIIHQGVVVVETGETVGVANLIMLSQQTDNGTYGSWSWLIGKNHNEEYYYYYWIAQMGFFWGSPSLLAMLLRC